ncbi:hypothetical protein IY145_16895 [Methylosinus sp. H3A]|uniref:hypothetical protein n=1 Tax=Methylosinus sp. H3A TaxID=2785786 RepID=UPI0018C225F6|nr:hypothetical protein [Methylosinus sp. H3A]MBG0811050.1 hypothetical protein [Methylosinus sp. H3A]
MFVVDRVERRDGRPAENSIIRGRELAALDQTSLRERFYSWRAADGERYVCTIFSAEEEALVAGFARAVVIGVACDGGQRRPVCVLASEDFYTKSGRLARVAAGALGVNEWHVRFCALPGALARRLAKALLN